MTAHMTAMDSLMIAHVMVQATAVTMKNAVTTPWNSHTIPG
jgi:hypothetical protein